MKTLFTILLSAILVVSISYAMTDDPVKKEKQAHIKIIKDANGKELLIDTVFTKENSEEMKEFLRKMDIDLDIELDDKTGETTVKVIKTGDGECMETELVELMDLDIDSELMADSTLKKIIVTAQAKGDHVKSKKIFISSSNDGETILENECVKIISSKGREKPHMKFIKHHSSDLIDLNDENIISIKRKEMKDGNEKIEIIRKKQKEN